MFFENGEPFSCPGPAVQQTFFSHPTLNHGLHFALRGGQMVIHECGNRRSSGVPAQPSAPQECRLVAADSMENLCGRELQYQETNNMLRGASGLLVAAATGGAEAVVRSGASQVTQSFISDVHDRMNENGVDVRCPALSTLRESIEQRGQSMTPQQMVAWIESIRFVASRATNMATAMVPFLNSADSFRRFLRAQARPGHVSTSEIGDAINYLRRSLRQRQGLDPGVSFTLSPRQMVVGGPQQTAMTVQQTEEQRARFCSYLSPSSGGRSGSNGPRRGQ